MIHRTGLRRWLVALGLGMACAASAVAGPYSGLVVFGDSLSDVGNDAFITGSAIPATSVYSGGGVSGRFTNGANYIDGMASALGLSVAPSLQGGSVYAYGGARTASISPDLVAAGGLNFNQQLSAYYGSHQLADPNALYVLWIGANDMSDAILARALQGNMTAIPTAIGTAMAGIGNAIAGLAGRGAQHFLVPNLPDLSLVPEARALNNPGLSFLAQSASQAFNQNLDATLNLAGFAALDIHGLNVFAAQTTFTANPQAFGFSNVTGACYSGGVDGQPRGGAASTSTCADPDEYLCFDYEHPTAALHAQLATLALAAVVPEPASVLLWLAGIGVLLLWRRGRQPGSASRSGPPRSQAVASSASR